MTKPITKPRSDADAGLASIDGEWAIQAAGEPIHELLAENLGGGDGVSPFDLPRISVPTGGGASFMVPGVGGETAEREIEGIILHTRMSRAWYAMSFEEVGGGHPPDCVSEDGVVGVGALAEKHGTKGEPFLCETCPNSRFGSDRRGGGGQDCSSIRPIFLLRRGDLLPVRINVPAGSIRNARTFLVACTMAGLRYHQVLVRLGLEKRSQQNGSLEYAAITFEIAAPLDPRSRELVDAMRTALSPMFGRASASEIGKEASGDK